MLSRAFKIVLLCLVAGVAWPARAETLDDLPEVVSEYARGDRLMRQGDYLEASRIFTQLAAQYPDSRNLDLFIFSRAKAKMYFGEQADALATFDGFITRFPASPYLAHAYYFKGNLSYQRGQTQRAFEAYAEAYRLSTDGRLTRLVTNSLVEMLDRARAVELGTSDFGAMSEKERCDLTAKLADALVARQNYRTANQLLSICGRSIEAPGVEVADTLLGSLEIAVVLPFSGEYQPYGDEIFQGAVVAAEQFRKETGHAVTLVPYDTKGDPIDAARIVKELNRSGGSDAAIGPLTSEEAAVASGVLACGNLPMVTPAATQAGLTLLSESSFQLLPNIELQGVRAAEYAVINRGADSAAIITPTGTDQLRMARAFADRFQDLGGTIVATEYYRPRDKDFGPQIRDIKALLISGRLDSTQYVSENGDTLDIEAVPVGIDCLYLPGMPDQLRLLLPQLNYFTVQAFYLGSDGWGDDAIYRLGDMVTKQAVFPSPFLEQRRGDTYYEFASAFDDRYGKKPGRLAGLGYDAARLVLEAAAGAGSRQGLIDNLRRVKEYRGASGTVTFGQDRENVELPLYQIVDGLPVYLGESGAQPGGTE